MTKAVETAAIAAQGPRTMAAKAPPTAWPVLPPGIGILNIMITKEKAPARATSGRSFLGRTERIFTAARHHSGAMTAYIVPYVCGLRYPSGICIASGPLRPCTGYRKSCYPILKKK